MLKSFIRFTETNIDPLAVNSCEEDSFCDTPTYEYPIPAVNGDVIQWQMNESEIDVSIYDLIDFKIGLTDECGNLIEENVGSIVEAGDGLLQCSATVPEGLEGCYRFFIYVDYTPVDCDLYIGSTVEDLIADGVLLGDVLECIPVPDWV